MNGLVRGIIFILSGFLITGLLAMLGCDQNGSLGNTGEQPPLGPDQLFVDARFVVTEEGATNAIVRADSVMAYQGRGLSIVEGNLRVDFYNRQGERISTLTAERGIVYGMTESIDSLRAEDRVVINWERRKARMETPFIRWIAATRMVYADSTVELSVDNAMERGVRFAAPDDLSSYTMGQVTGVIQDLKIDLHEK